MGGGEWLDFVKLKVSKPASGARAGAWLSLAKKCGSSQTADIVGAVGKTFVLIISFHTKVLCNKTR